MVVEAAHAWLDEIDLDPEGSWLRMGTRALGNQPWLVVDERREAELALKAELLATHHAEVFAVDGDPATDRAGHAVLDLVTTALSDSPASLALTSTPAPSVAGGVHPLDAAGRLVQEDLCLLRRSEAGWLLVGASLCFPSRWRLADKLGRPLGDVHGPVDGYAEALSARVDRLIDRLDDRIVRRRNWFIHPDPALFQPDRPVGREPVVEADRCLDELYLRSERQTLRRLDPGDALFTIRTQQAPLRALVEVSPERRSALRTFVADAADALIEHRGVCDEQRRHLTSALATLGPDPARPS